jgi:predicted PurR-regulated permease PerM
VEYVVRPALIGTDIKMPDLLVLVGTLGGLYLFGPIGFIVGPIVCGLFLTVWDIYGTTFRGILVPEKTTHADAEQDQTTREITD